MQTHIAKKDLGKKETYAQWNGKFLGDDSYDELLTVTDEDVRVNKPFKTIDGGNAPLAAVVTNVYPDDSVKEMLKSISDVSVMRANCAGPIVKEEMEAKGLKEGVDYKLRTPNSYYVKTKSGDWGKIAYCNEISSVMIGYKRGRFTGKIDVAGWCKENPDKWERFSEISEWNEKAFKKGLPEVYEKQKKWIETFVRPEHRVGMFTTFSANRYHVGQSKAMSAHVDSGDLDAGLTTMNCFRDGDYDGAYLCFPRYGIAINAPDNSVIIADSNEVHGVTYIKGNGTRYTTTAYCDNRLATLGSAGKPERLIGKVAKEQENNLESFFG